jgi:6-phosphogluconolactonase
MHHQVVVLPDPASMAVAAADHVVAHAARSVAFNGRFHFAVSGGRTPQAMFEQLSDRDMPWGATTIYQVDERIAPIDDPDRNLAHLTEALAGVPATVVAMPVEEPDPLVAAQQYAEQLPESFDLVHLGLGPDGHTASLVPDDDVLAVDDRLVALTSSIYQGRRRMTLTYPALARAAQLLWLVSGSSKARALKQLLAGDPSMPAGRVTAGGSVVMADSSAAGEQETRT